MDIWKYSLNILLVIFSLNLQGQSLPQPTFENPPELSTESGYVKLSWLWNPDIKSGEILEFELQYSDNEFFNSPSEIYKGPDYATFLSGLKNGDYYYRVRGTAKVEGEMQLSDWSDPVLVRVKHHSLQLAFLLFGIGAVVFLLTVGIVMQGSRKTSSSQNQ